MDLMTVIKFALFGFVVLWMLAWVWMLWRWSFDILYGLKRGTPFNDVVWTIATSALYALIALLPLYVALLFWSEFSAAFPA